MKCGVQSQEHAHYHFQIRQPHQQCTFYGPARQFGSDGKAIFAKGIGRDAMPLMQKNILPVAEENVSNSVSIFVPDFTNIASGKKQPRKAVGDVSEKLATKITKDSTQA